MCKKKDEHKKVIHFFPLNTYGLIISQFKSKKSPLHSTIKNLRLSSKDWCQSKSHDCPKKFTMQNLQQIIVRMTPQH